MLNRKISFSDNSKFLVPLVLVVLLGTFTVGCESNADFMTEDRQANGLVIILPGIEGEGSYNHDIRRGLVMAGVNRAIPIHNWGRPIPGIGMLLNQMDAIGNRMAGERIAEMVENYQDKYPGRPVHIIGHSGGGGVAVFAAEALAPGRKLDGLILLHASISEGYELTKVLGKCKNGLVNYYNPDDGGLLGLGTSIVGNVDGSRGDSSGLNGFRNYWPKLYQVHISRGMSMGGDSHGVATKPSFIVSYVSDWVTSDTWPPPASVVTSGR